MGRPEDLVLRLKSLHTESGSEIRKMRVLDCKSKTIGDSFIPKHRIPTHRIQDQPNTPITASSSAAPLPMP